MDTESTTKLFRIGNESIPITLTSREWDIINEQIQTPTYEDGAAGWVNLVSKKMIKYNLVHRRIRPQIPTRILQEYLPDDDFETESEDDWDDDFETESDLETDSTQVI